MVLMLLWLFDLIIGMSQYGTYFFIALTAAFSMALFFLNFKEVVKRLHSIQRNTYLFLALIMLLGFCLRLIEPSCTGADGNTWEHVSYGERILHGNFFLSKGDIDHSKGYALMLAGLFLFFGRSLEAIAFLNILFSVLTIPVAFFIAYSISGHREASLFSALLFSLFPLSIVFAAYGSPHTAALFFSSLAFLFFLFFLGQKTMKSFALASALLAFSIHLRLECTILVPVFLLGTFCSIKHPLRKESFKKPALFSIILFLFLFPLISFYILMPFRFGYISDESSSASVWANARRGNQEAAFDERFPNMENPPVLSIAFLPVNIPWHLKSLLDEKFFPVLLFFFPFLSLLYLRKSHKAVFLLLWLVFFFLLFGTWWATSITPPFLYQIQIITPLSVLVSLGVLSCWNAIKNLIKKAGNPRYRVPLSIVFSIAVAFMLFFSLLSSGIFSLSGTSYWKETPCITRQLRQASGKFGGNTCILIDNTPLRARLNPFLIAKYTLPEMNIQSKPNNCQSKKSYFFFLEQAGHHTNSLPETPLFNAIRKECLIGNRVEIDGLSFYRLKC